MISNEQKWKATKPGKHPLIAAMLIDDAAKLREKARALLRMEPPEAPSANRGEAFPKLWLEAWKSECFSDAAKILEAAAGGISPTHDLVSWRD